MSAARGLADRDEAREPLVKGGAGLALPGATGQPGEVLSLRDVSVVLGGREVLSHVEFAVGRGEFTGLIGSNGAGKTTIFRVILGLTSPSSGEVHIEGVPRPRRNAAIGYVPQRVLLDPDVPLRARDLVALGIDGNRLGFPRPSAARHRLVDELLESVNASGFADERVGNLSGGEQQRVLIAHALISRPKLLLLDEPLANLDLKSEQEVIELLSLVARNDGVSVLISAHEMNPLLPVMDRIVYVAGGRAASGTTDEVVRQDVLSSLYGRHVDVLKVHDRVIVVAGRGVEADVELEKEHVDGLDLRASP